MKISTSSAAKRRCRGINNENCSCRPSVRADFKSGMGISSRIGIFSPACSLNRFCTSAPMSRKRSVKNELEYDSNIGFPATIVRASKSQWTQLITLWHSNPLIRIGNLLQNEFLQHTAYSMGHAYSVDTVYKGGIRRAFWMVLPDNEEREIKKNREQQVEYELLGGYGAIHQYTHTHICIHTHTYGRFSRLV